MRRFALGAMALSLVLSFSSAAQAQDACSEIRRVRNLANDNGLDSSTLDELARRYCRGPGGPPSGGGWQRPPRPIARPAIDDAEFDNTVMRAIRQASTSEEGNTCRYYARVIAVTTDQVIRVIRAVSARNEAACALAFFPVVVDPLQWERVYVPMSSSAEHEVRAAVGR